MLRIARALGARVQGDDGESYNRPEDMPSEEEFAELLDPKPLFARPRLAASGCLLVASALAFVFAAGAVSIWRRLGG